MRGSLSPKDCILWKHEASKAPLLQGQPEVPTGFSVGAKWAPWVPVGWTSVQTGIRHFLNQKWRDANKRQPEAKH